MVDLLERSDTTDVIFEEIDDSKGPSNPEKGLEDWLKELGGKEDIEIRVYRDASEKTNGKMPFLFEFSPDTFSMTQLLTELRDSYGTDTYRLRCYVNGRLIFNKRLSVENTVSDKRKEDEKRPNFSSDNKMNELLQIVNANQKATDDKFQALVLALSQNQAPPVAPIDPMTMMTGMMTAMMQMKNFMSPPEGQLSPVDLISKGVDLAAKLNPSDKEANSNDTLMELIRTFGAPIAEGVKNLAQPLQPLQPLQQNPIDQSLPPQQTMQTNPVSHLKPNDVSPFANTEIKQLLDTLLLRAKSNGDPTLYADMVLEAVPHIEQIMGDEPIGALLVKINRDVANYGPWFDELDHAIRHPYNDDASVDDLTNDGTVIDNDENSSIDSSEPSSIEPTD